MERRSVGVVDSSQGGLLLGQHVLVIHDYVAYERAKPAPNLVAYSPSGEHVWTAQNLTPSSPTDAYVNFISEEPLWVGNFAGCDCKIDPQTGKLLESIFTK
jgi:hypothetical protein